MLKHLRFDADPADDERVAQLLEAAAAAGDRPIADVTTLRRGNPQRLSAPVIRQPAAAQVEAAQFAGVSGEWIVPPNAADDIVILYCHGGAYVRGSLQQGRAIACALARGTGARVAAIAWAQAPERVFPVPVHDVTTAFNVLLDMGIPASSIVLAGDSAGGAIVVSGMVAQRDAGQPLPLACVSISPWADLSLSGGTWRRNQDRDIIGPNYARSAAALYLKDTDPRDPLASPIFADLGGLPPMLVVAGEDEVLLDDAVSLSNRAAEAGVPTVLHTYRKMIHVFPMFSLRTGDLALQKAVGYILERQARRLP